MKCIFLDIDGTILDHETGIQDSTKLAICQARANGHKVCLATGRSKPEVDKEILDLGFDGYIYACGSLVETKTSMLLKKFLHIKDIEHILNLLKSHHVGFNLEGMHNSFLDEIGYSFFHNIFLQEKHMNSELARQYMASARMNRFCSMQKSDYDQILKIAIFARHINSCISIQNSLHPHLTFIIHQSLDASTINGEIMYRDISKASGMQLLLDHFHIPVSNSIAIGDSMNDAEMIVFAANGIAMENACESLKVLSDHCTTSSKNNGIYNAFKKCHII